MAWASIIFDVQLTKNRTIHRIGSRFDFRVEACSMLSTTPNFTGAGSVDGEAHPHADVRQW